jgi:hypothetical protein
MIISNFLLSLKTTHTHWILEVNFLEINYDTDTVTQIPVRSSNVMLFLCLIKQHAIKTHSE